MDQDYSFFLFQGGLFLFCVVLPFVMVVNFLWNHDREEREKKVKALEEDLPLGLVVQGKRSGRYIDLERRRVGGKVCFITSYTDKEPAEVFNEGSEFASSQN